MSRRDEPVSPRIIRTAAELTINQHEPGGNIWHPGKCWQCTPNGCPQLRWAFGILDGQDPPYPTPARAPSELDVPPTARGVVPRQRMTAR